MVHLFLFITLMSLCSGQLNPGASNDLSNILMTLKKAIETEDKTLFLDVMPSENHSDEDLVKFFQASKGFDFSINSAVSDNSKNQIKGSVALSKGSDLPMGIFSIVLEKDTTRQHGYRIASITPEGKRESWSMCWFGPFACLAAVFGLIPGTLEEVVGLPA